VSGALVSRVCNQRGRRLLAVGFLACLIPVSCGRLNPFPVRSIVAPEYPLEAHVNNIEGTVQVNLCVGADGRVTEAIGVGGGPILARAAESDARQWTFGPLPAAWTYPDCRTVVKYVYRLEGPPASVVISAATVRTDLPNQVEIVARPFASDYPSPVKKGATAATRPAR
jgi:hypothetical protein